MVSFRGPLIRLKEGQEVTVNIVNDTDTPEQLHWHGQKVSTDIDGSAEEGTPYIPAHGQRRITFTPNPAGLRFYHTHNRAGADLSAGQYSGQVGTVYIEPKENAGRYDREVFLTLKEFEPTLSRGGDMSQDFLSPSAIDKTLKETGEAAMKASLAKGMPHGFEVGCKFFTINGRMLGHGEPIRAKQGERVLFHILNGSATEIRSLALPWPCRARSITHWELLYKSPAVSLVPKGLIKLVGILSGKSRVQSDPLDSSLGEIFLCSFDQGAANPVTAHRLQGYEGKNSAAEIVMLIAQRDECTDHSAHFAIMHRHKRAIAVIVCDPLQAHLHLRFRCLIPELAHQLGNHRRIVHIGYANRKIEKSVGRQDGARSEAAKIRPTTIMSRPTQARRH